jgi:predicted AlkP superfamily pyrophosphatase or phosphodiesterase
MKVSSFAPALLIFLGTVHASEQPRLVLQLTVDQLRGDMLPRYREKFGPGGINLLLSRGIYYANAHYPTGNTFTASGHAVLVTGADTAEHGMVANDWWDRTSAKPIYSTFDPRHPVLGEPDGSPGMSPTNLGSTTIGDELVAASGGRSRVFAVAGKDRSAIIPAGHSGTAYWFSDRTGNFTTSTYYANVLPAWVSDWNGARPIEPFRGRTWHPLHELATYTGKGSAANAHARPTTVIGRTFPHPLVVQSDALFLAAFRFTPFLDELTLRFATELVARERLGQQSGTDYLSISLSGHDYIGHAFGPESVEYEDSLLRIDRLLGEFLAMVDRQVGLDRTIVVLSADHGVDDIPEAHRSRRINAGRIYPKTVLENSNVALREKFNLADDLIAGFVTPGLYFNEDLLHRNRLERRTVEEALADHLRGQPGIAYAFTRSDLLTGSLPRTPLSDRVQRAFHPQRSGDVVVVQKQFWYLYPAPEAFAAMHGSPYSYDTFVPIVVAAPGTRPSTVHRPVQPGDIPATLAALLSIKPPSGSVGNVLVESLERK